MLKVLSLMKKYWYEWNVLCVLIASLSSITAVSGDLTQARISLIYYKDFPAQAIKNNVPVPGCILKTNSDKSGRVLWHCLERIYLIRPLSQVALLKQKQHRLKFNSAAFDLNHTNARIVSVHPLKKPPALSDSGYVPVTGIFITHSFKVKRYQFKNDRTGRISELRATVSHPFYVENSGSFVPVSSVSSTDHLLNNKHETVQLLCPAGRTVHCGVTVSESLPMRVYNLESYKKHTFFAGSEETLVHNGCVFFKNYIKPTLPWWMMDPYTRSLVETAGTTLSSESAELLWGKVPGAQALDIKKAVYYGFIGALNEHSLPGVLFMDHATPWSLYNRYIALSPDDVLRIISPTPGFDKAETIFFINGAPNTMREAINRDFTGYFQKIADLSGKNVVFNTFNPLFFVPCHNLVHPARVQTVIAGFDTNASWTRKAPYYTPFWLYNNSFVCVRPHK